MVASATATAAVGMRGARHYRAISSDRRAIWHDRRTSRCRCEVPMLTGEIGIGLVGVLLNI